MSQVTFVTSNQVKYDSAKHLVASFGVELLRENMDLQEIQSESGEAIVRNKAEQAFRQLQRPIVVSDDTWIIPGLNGFPGPYMKYVNDWLTPEDFLRLTLPLKDRRIILRQHSVYQDASGQQYFVGDINCVLLTEIRGSSPYSHITITSLDGGKHSGAEVIASGKPAIIADKDTVWHRFGEWMASNHA